MGEKVIQNLFQFISHFSIQPHDQMPSLQLSELPRTLDWSQYNETYLKDNPYDIYRILLSGIELALEEFRVLNSFGVN